MRSHPGVRDHLMNRRLRVAPGKAPAQQAFEELLAANLDALYASALRLCKGRAADAEDLLHDSVLRAFDRRADLREAAAGRRWLFTILVRTHLNRVRSERRRRESFESDLDENRFERSLSEWEQREWPDDRVERNEADERVRAAIDGLDPDLRTIVLLADVEEFSHREVAAMLDLPEGTVASRLFRARRALRVALRDASLVKGEEKNRRSL
jgi:RNA polymerase sigma-70 factor (ECF subfamily)